VFGPVGGPAGGTGGRSRRRRRRAGGPDRGHLRPRGDRADPRGRPDRDSAHVLLHPPPTRRPAVRGTQHLRSGRLRRLAPGGALQRARSRPGDRRRRRAAVGHPDRALRAQPGRPGHLLRAAPLGGQSRRCARPGAAVVGVHRQPGERRRRPGRPAPAGRQSLPGNRGDQAVRRMGGLADGHLQPAGGRQRTGRNVEHAYVRIFRRRHQRPRQHPLHARTARRHSRHHHLRLRAHSGPAAGRDDRPARAGAQPAARPDPAPDGRSGLSAPVRRGRIEREVRRGAGSAPRVGPRVSRSRS